MDQTKTRIYLSSPHMGGDEQYFIQQAFNSNWVAPLGPNVDEFERSLEEYLGEESQVAVLSSGTAALHLALVLCGVSAGDEVICQSFTFAASANPIVYCGAKPVFVDSETSTWNISPEYLEEAIVSGIKRNKKPKAIIAVHLYGNPYQVAAIQDIASKYQIPIIEDSAEALGSKWKNTACGTFGDFGILSFNGNKIITTSGGGALVTKSAALKTKAIFLASQARDAAAHYEHSQIGFNYRMSNVLAGIGRGQMLVLNQHVEHRRAMRSFYEQLFETVPYLSIFNPDNADRFSNAWLSTALISDNDKKIDREAIRLAMEQENIETRPLWKPLHLQPVFRECAYFGTNSCEALFNQGVCLPSGSNLSDADRERIRYSFAKIFDL
ncbi:MAG: aminotransferase class I/II-fold pyridoxal phosphate-dependent enzyme [Flavobacteriaceae bacterium]|nr:aminotransferase class I/II-fold pyridoxal phosphate-dependent enzyme [Flavobacteriaceae bacterium]